MQRAFFSMDDEIMFLSHIGLCVLGASKKVQGTSMRSDLIGTADTNLSFLCVRWVHTHTPQSFLDSGQGPKNIEVCRIAVGRFAVGEGKELLLAQKWTRRFSTLGSFSYSTDK